MKKNVPYVIAVASQKGGVGKSTISQHLAVLLATNYGLNVTLYDMDPQKTTANWAVGRGYLNEENLKDGRLFPTDYQAIKNQISKYRNKHEPFIVDCGKEKEGTLKVVCPQEAYNNIEFLENNILMSDSDVFIIDCSANFNLYKIRVMMIANHIIYPMTLGDTETNSFLYFIDDLNNGIIKNQEMLSKYFSMNRKNKTKFNLLINEVTGLKLLNDRRVEVSKRITEIKELKSFETAREFFELGMFEQYIKKNSALSKRNSQSNGKTAFDVHKLGEKLIPLKEQFDNLVADVHGYIQEYNND